MPPGFQQTNIIPIKSVTFPKIIILCGIPNSGKSTWTGMYCSATKSIWMSRDEIRERSGTYVYSKQNEDKITEIYNYELDSFIRGHLNIILDNTHVQEKYINDILKKVEGLNYDVYIKFFDIPLWKAYWREFWRRKKSNTKKKVPFSAIKRMHSQYKKINKNNYKHMIL